MKGAVQWLVGVVRVGPEFNEMGDPFDFACTVLIDDNDGSVTILGAAGKFSAAHKKALKEALNSQGITKAKWIRMKPSGEKHRKGE